MTTTEKENNSSEFTPDEYRTRRIERLLKELRYEVERGIMQGEIQERFGYRFIIPRSKELPVDGVVVCMFEARPTPAHYVHGIEGDPPGLKLVE